MAINLKGYVYDSVGAANSVTVEGWHHDGVAAAVTTTTDADGMWSHASLDATKQWRIKVIDGTKVQWIDGRSKLQLTELDLITSVTVDTINEHTSASGVTIDGLVIKDSQLTVGDNLLLKLGADADIAFMNRSTVLNANTTLTGLLEGTVVAQAIAANSLMVANQTNDGDLAFYISKGGNSQMVFWADGSTGDTAVMASASASVDVYIAGTKEIDYSTGLMAFQQATGITAAGLLTFQGSTNQGVQFWGGTFGDNLSLILAGRTAADGESRNSPILSFRGYYDADPTAGVTSTARSITMQHIIYTAGAAPESHLVFTTPGGAILDLDDSNGTRRVGFFAADPVARQAHVADPAGGGTADAEARTAINAILLTLERFGFHATS